MTSARFLRTIVRPPGRKKAKKHPKRDNRPLMSTLREDLFRKDLRTDEPVSAQRGTLFKMILFEGISKRSPPKDNLTGLLKKSIIVLMRF
jgi:hypothetical protein